MKTTDDASGSPSATATTGFTVLELLVALAITLVLAGLMLAAAGAAVLITESALHGDAWQIASSSIFAASMVLLYGASTLYHSVRGAAKKVLVKFDHCAIYLLIAGTYTPFTLVTLRGPWGWALFGTVWGLAVIGIVKELCLGRERVPSVPLYVAMGWLGVIAAVPMVQELPGAGLGLVGLAERVALADGSFEHGEDAAGRFVGRATLPWTP